jgi:hydroxymethylbilane synthase
MYKPLIYIGTRDSQLAQWQSKEVQQLLQSNNRTVELVLIKSEGDLNLTTPLYEMGVQGIFTKTLDAALLDQRIDLAVHSYKDVPTKLADGLQIAAVLKRGNPFDILVMHHKQPTADIDTLYKNESLHIATSSIRRRSQWLNRFPGSTIENLRGNVNTRLQKLENASWHGALFAAAGLERLNITNLSTVELEWMLPAPAQGAIVIVCRKDDQQMIDACIGLNHVDTQLCTQVEKDFLRMMMGGCSTPVAAFAQIVNNEIYFKGNVLSADGIQKVTVELVESIKTFSTMGGRAAATILAEGGKEIMDSFNYTKLANE